MSGRGTERFAWDPLAANDALAALGFDVDLRDAWATGNLQARRDRGERATLVALDAAGRLRVEVTTTLAETASDADAAGIALRIVAVAQRVVTATGTLPVLSALAAAIAAAEAAAERGLAALPPIAEDATAARARPEWPS